MPSIGTGHSLVFPFHVPPFLHSSIPHSLEAQSDLDTRIHSTIFSREMDIDEDGNLLHGCRCGSSISIPEPELEECKRVVLPCESCSLVYAFVTNEDDATASDAEDDSADTATVQSSASSAHATAERLHSARG